MLKFWWFFPLFLLHFAFNVAGVFSIEDPIFSGSGVAVSVPEESLNSVSKSVLEAESWVKTHVLAHYPSTNITTIVVGHSFFCQKDKEEEKMGMVLPCLKNIHYSLTRWGLGGEIKVSTSFSRNCLDPDSETFKFGSAEGYIKPVVEFLSQINAPFLVSHVSDFPISEGIKNLGGFNLKKIALEMEDENVVFGHHISRRKLSFFESLFADSIPARPTPFLLSPSPAPSGLSSPAFLPLPPLVGTVSPPLPPPPYGPHLPPCKPSAGDQGSVAAPVSPVQGGLWCVAKPNVPPETLKEALDYACGQGGADCEAIRPQGSCYFPNTIVAHASYAFNSYWQRNKKVGGTCGFEGTAMLINSDPSYRHCRFVLA